MCIASASPSSLSLPLRITTARYERRFAAARSFDLEPDDNACPQSFQPAIHLNENGERQLELMRWAFRLPDKLLFNARSEGIEQAKFWADSFQKRRCIIPASAIQESQDLPDGKKGDKYEFDIPGREVFGMAGIWKLWKHPGTGQWESIFAVLTGEPNEVMQPVHNRLTTVLEPRDYAEYLAFSDRAAGPSATYFVVQ